MENDSSSERSIARARSMTTRTRSHPASPQRTVTPQSTTTTSHGMTKSHGMTPHSPTPSQGRTIPHYMTTSHNHHPHPSKRHTTTLLFGIFIVVAFSVQQLLSYIMISANVSGTENVKSKESNDVKEKVIETLTPSLPPATLSPTTAPISHEFAIDIISIGSTDRIEYQKQQERTFGSHKSVRQFYSVDEKLDSSEHKCTETLTIEHMMKIKDFCHAQWGPADSKIAAWLRNRINPYQKDDVTIDWLCVQKRHIDAMELLLEDYRTDPNVNTIPDYVLLINDDTYINMNRLAIALHNYTTRDDNGIAHQPLVLSGCVTNFPDSFQFKFPSSGYGSIFSRAAIQNLLRPIRCNAREKIIYKNLDPFTRMACWRLYTQNHLGELKYFEDGMSVSDLMFRYTKSLSFLNVNAWINGDGFCFHTEHALAYFIGFYHIAVPDHVLKECDLSDDVRKDSLYGYLEIDTSGLSSTTSTSINATMSQCSNFNYDKCNRDDLICRNIQPKQMESMFFDDKYIEV